MTELKKQIIQKRMFAYSKRSVSLSFELQDDVQYLKDFKSLLIEATKDIEDILEGVEN